MICSEREKKEVLRGMLSSGVDLERRRFSSGVLEKKCGRYVIVWDKPNHGDRHTLPKIMVHRRIIDLSVLGAAIVFIFKVWKRMQLVSDARTK